MSSDLIGFMEKKGHANIVQEITTKLAKFGLTVDFEAIYTVVEALTNIKESVKRNGPLAAYVCRDSLEETTQQQFKELLRDFKSYLYEACKLRSGYNDEIPLTLGKLF